MSTRVLKVGDTSLEVRTKGNNGPVVVFETGMGCSFYEWINIADEISKSARVILYHREGYGNSNLTEEKCTSRRISENLKLLLEEEKIMEPIILVGHSFGGLCALHFAKLFPNNIAGLILVDSSPMEMYKIEELKRSLHSIQTKYPTIKTLERMKTMGNMSETKILEEINPQLSPWQHQLPTNIQHKIKDFIIKPNLYKAEASELENMIQSGREIESLGSMSYDIPIKVLGRDGNIEINNLINAGIVESEAITFESLIQELNIAKAKYSSKGEFLLINGAGHNIHQYCPEIIIQSILEIIGKLDHI